MIHVEKAIQDAHTAFDQGRAEDAERELLAVLEFDDAEPRALRLLGQVAMRRGQPQRAAELFQSALKAREPGTPSPRGPVPTPTLAELYAKQGHTAAAAQTYRTLLERAGNDQRARQWRQRVVELEAEPSAEAAADDEAAGPEQRLRAFLEQLDRASQVRRLRQFVEKFEAGPRA